MSLIAVSGLNVSLGGRPVLSDVSFSVAGGELVGLIGANGAGKSTLLRAALGLVPGHGGIEIAGRDAASMKARERARHIAYLPQEREIAWPVTVETLVALGRDPHRPRFAGLSQEDRVAIEAAMRRADVLAFRHRPATELSGGEQALVLIARALAQDAPLLLADEPTAGLDPAHQIALMRVFRALTAGGKAVVASLHDLGLAARWCSRVILLDKGSIVADGPPAEVLTPAHLRSVYGIEALFAEAAGSLVVHPLDLAGGRDKP